MTEHPINQWTFKIREDKEKPISWVYEDVKHCGYNFATEISIEKIILEVEEQGQSKPIPLEFSSFEGLSGEQLAGFKEYNPTTGKYSMSVSNFAAYEGKGMLLALRTKKDVLLDNNVDGKPVAEPLYLFFTILFGNYGIDPPHEFTGALQAARFTPALRFETKNDSVRSIRVHYRFHFDVDSYLQNASELTKLTEEAKKKERGIENYASVIRDADHFPPSLMPAIHLLKDVVALFADVKFFKSQLDACNFDGTCRFETARMELVISDAGGSKHDRLNISFRDPRASLTNVTTALKKTSAQLTDKKVGALHPASSLEYDEPAIDKLAAKIYAVIVGSAKKAQGLDSTASMTVSFGDTPLPGVSDACLTSNIKYSLVHLALRNYCRDKGADILKQLKSVDEKASTDLADILKYLDEDLFKKVLKDITSLIRSILQEPLVPVVGQVLTLLNVATLTESIQQLAGKIISIASFDAVEKPVLHELIGPYIEVGNVIDTWDNLHWWGTEEIPSAPGAFHAIHSHYRWTQLNTYPTAEEAQVLEVLNAAFGSKKPLHLGAPQLRSLVRTFAANRLSGPLIDPHIPNQTICLALAVNHGELDKELKTSDAPFEEVSVTPQAIAGKAGNNSKDIVYWISCKALRTSKEVFKGTLLVNGFYFAHEEEKPFSLFLPANLFALTQGVALQKPERPDPCPLFRRPYS